MPGTSPEKSCHSVKPVAPCVSGVATDTASTVAGASHWPACGRTLAAISEVQESIRIARAPKRRVDEVLPDPAEQLLDQNNGQERADGRDPPRRVRGKVERQQQAGDHRAQVRHGSGPAHVLLVQVFRGDRAEHGYDNQHQRASRRKTRRRHTAVGQQRDDDVQHNALRACRLVVQVRRVKLQSVYFCISLRRLFLLSALAAVSVITFLRGSAALRQRPFGRTAPGARAAFQAVERAQLLRQVIQAFAHVALSISDGHKSIGQTSTQRPQRIQAVSSLPASATFPAP